MALMVKGKTDRGGFVSDFFAPGGLADLLQPRAPSV